MEPQYSVLIYSKYSVNCKKIMDMLNTLNREILVKFCIDNKKVRSRIQNDMKIKINIVPCILNVYENGRVMQYDGTHAFKWVEEVLEQFRPPPPPPKPVEVPKPPPKEAQKPPPPVSSYTDKTSLDDLDVPDRMVPIDRDDRHTNPAPPSIPRLQQGHEVIEDPNLFQGEQPSTREHPRNVIKNNTSTKTQDDPHGTMARAKALAQGREQVEANIANPSRRPPAPR